MTDGETPPPAQPQPPHAQVPQPQSQDPPGPEAVPPRGRIVQKFAAAAVAILLYLIIADAAVETIINGSPSQWIILGTVVVYFILNVALWRYLSWSTRAAASILLLFALAAGTAWLPGGLTQGIILLRQPTSVVLAVVTGVAILLAAVILAQWRFAPLVGRLALGLVALYGLVAVGAGIMSRVPYAELFHGRSEWQRFPFWLQGVFLAALLLTPATFLIHLIYGLIRVRGRRLQTWGMELAVLALGSAIAVAGFTGPLGLPRASQPPPAAQQPQAPAQQNPPSSTSPPSTSSLQGQTPGVGGGTQTPQASQTSEPSQAAGQPAQQPPNAGTQPTSQGTSAVVPCQAASQPATQASPEATPQGATSAGPAPPQTAAPTRPAPSPQPRTIDFSTVFVDPHPPICCGTIGFAFAGDLFVGSVQTHGTNTVLYSTNLSGKSVAIFAPTIDIPTSPSDEHFVASSLGLAGFPSRDIYVAAGNSVIHINHAGTTGSTFVSGLVGDVRGILFDAVGTFGNDMLITTNSGSVYRVDCAGHKTLLASIGEDTEGLDVAPTGPGAHFGPYDGQLIVASEGSGQLRAVSPSGTVTVLPLKGAVVNGIIPGGPEELTFVPLNLGASGNPVEGFYGSDYPPNVIKVPASAFSGLQGDIVVTQEFAHGVLLVQFDPADGKFAVSSLGSFPNQPEDGIFVTPAIIKGSQGAAPAPVQPAPQPPGELLVRYAPEVQALSRNIEIILDASGSMNTKLEQSTRLAVAKQVLSDLVRRLPPDTNVALRVFGHRKAGRASCTDTELLVPLGRVALATMIAKVNAIHALGDTPLVANLLLAARDMAGARAGTVVAVTDGEETCGGNVDTVASQLRSTGVQLVVNIVGFTLTDQQVIATWTRVAEGTGGGFFKAENTAQLTAALRTATHLEYVVYDAQGKLAGKAEVGKPLHLPGGTYTLIVRASRPVKVEGVKVEANRTTTYIMQRKAAGWSIAPEGKP